MPAPVPRKALASGQQADMRDGVRRLVRLTGPALRGRDLSLHAAAVQAVEGVGEHAHGRARAGDAAGQAVGPHRGPELTGSRRYRSLSAALTEDVGAPGLPPAPSSTASSC